MVVIICFLGARWARWWCSVFEKWCIRGAQHPCAFHSIGMLRFLPPCVCVSVCLLVWMSVVFDGRVCHLILAQIFYTLSFCFLRPAVAACYLLTLCPWSLFSKYFLLTFLLLAHLYLSSGDTLPRRYCLLLEWWVWIISFWITYGICVLLAMHRILLIVAFFLVDFSRFYLHQYRAESLQLTRKTYRYPTGMLPWRSVSRLRSDPLPFSLQLCTVVICTPS